LETWGEQLPVMLSFFKELGYKPYHLQNSELIDAEKITLAEIASSDILFVPPQRIKKVHSFLQEKL
jgi:hypothetical protein